jgi:radical SAM superfamily enzyme YgiQ (UPF0313 family)
MKIVIGYPPLESNKGIPFLGQNRQFQWAHTPWTAYPMVPAYAATMLDQQGHQVDWLDGISENWTYQQWEDKLLKINPDVLVIESKTPVIKNHWQIIKQLKNKQPDIKIVLVGDHVTAKPKESLNNSPTDYIVVGGNYDFGLVELIKKIDQDEADDFKILKSQNLHNIDLNKLPVINRDLTKWELYAYQNSNYGRLPGTYTMFARDCWWGKCSFCSWANFYPDYKQMSPQRALKEIDHIINNYPVKEIMDDSGTFPVGKWLTKFCQGMIDRKYNQQIRMNCNMRFNADLTQQDYNLMGKAGFRFLLYGLESANQKTLDKLNKNLKVEQIKPNLRKAKQAGLKPHITVMIGYPWETEQDIQNTLNFVKQLYQEKLVDSLQSTLIIPYPGTDLFQQAKQNNWLKTLDWNSYDMRQPILKTSLSDQKLKDYVRKFYSLIFTPSWMLWKLKEGITNWETFKYYSRFAKRFISKQIDFK